MNDERGDEGGGARVNQKAGLGKSCGDLGAKDHEDGDGRNEQAEEQESSEAMSANDITPISLLVLTADAATRESLALQFGPAN